MATFEDKAQSIVATAAHIARLRGATSEARVLDSATASLVQTGYDNWDGGTYFYTLMLEVPIPIYASIEEQRETLERAIHDRTTQLVRGEAGNSITQVVISPALADASRPTGPRADELSNSEEIPSFWQRGFFRLFISHTAATKSSAHRLKEALATYQVAAFVAHDDIEPTKEWQAEIERALRTADALVAIITAGFIESRWCDQEVGFGIGRGKLVVPICAGADPHGFLAKHQGIQASGNAAAIAERLIGVLIKHPLPAQRMTDALIDRLASSQAFEASKRTMALIEQCMHFNNSQIARLVQSIDENIHVRDAFGVPNRIRSLVSRTS